MNAPFPLWRGSGYSSVSATPLVIDAACKKGSRPSVARAALAYLPTSTTFAA